jgi:hypothetical protein
LQAVLLMPCIERHQRVAMRREQWKDAVQLWQQNGGVTGRRA